MSNRVVNKPDALKLELYGDGNSVVFGENTQGFRGQLYIGTPDCPAYCCFVSVGPGSTSNGVFIHVLDDNSRVEIGKDCMFSDEINIWASDTHTILDDAGHVANMGRFISIGDHVWVGKRATILKNTYIAPNSVIGWGTVVSGTFDKAGSVIAGNSATVVKTITDWSRMRPCQYIRKIGNSARYNPNMEKDIFVKSERAFAVISRDWESWAARFPARTKTVVGISGGVDSTCVAALACRIFGAENVVGVSLPCDGQKDMADVDAVFEHLKIRRVTVDIGDAFSALKNGIENNAVGLTEQCVTNMPARLRMTALFGVAQCLGGVVVNTCNRSESVCGYDTFGGDNMGCYAPIKNLVKTEVMDLTAWLGVPEKLARKVPVDGLQPLTDEQKLGFLYAELDAFIRCPTAVEDGLTKPGTAEKIRRMYAANRFKLEIINIPGPDFSFASDVFRAGVYS